MGEASDGLEAVALVERLRPDVLVVDIYIPGLPGAEVIRQAQALAPGTHIVVLSMHADESHVREAAAGRRYLSLPPLYERAIEAYISQVGAPWLTFHDSLNPRERGVLRLTADGHTAAQIAELLSLRARTIESYWASLMRKLGLRGQTDLLRYALGRGIIPPK